MSTDRPAIQVAVVMRKTRVEGAMSRWQSWRWALADVLLHDDGFGMAARMLYKNEHEERWLYPGFTVELFRDDAEGYYLNATSPQPGWFVMWRMEDEPGLSDECLPLPQVVTLSYHDAGRWLDAQESVEQVPASAEIVAWLSSFVDANYEPDPKRRKRPESFRALTDRFGNPASISTGKKYGGGHGG